MKEYKVIYKFKDSPLIFTVGNTYEAFKKYPEEGLYILTNDFRFCKTMKST